MRRPNPSTNPDRDPYPNLDVTAPPEATMGHRLEVFRPFVQHLHGKGVLRVGDPCEGDIAQDVSAVILELPQDKA